VDVPNDYGVIVWSQNPSFDHILPWIYGNYNDKFLLGRWLGPAIDVGPAMTGKILKPNYGNTQYVSTYRALTPEEYEMDEVKAKKEAFNTEIHKVLSPAATAEDVKDEFEDSEWGTVPNYEEHKRPQERRPCCRYSRRIYIP
jgi:hypothetical protein